MSKVYQNELQERIDRYARMAEAEPERDIKAYYAGKVAGLKQAWNIYRILNGDFNKED